MSIKYSILIEQLEVFISSKKQIDRILHDYENEIKNIVNEIKNMIPLWKIFINYSVFKMIYLHCYISIIIH